MLRELLLTPASAKEGAVTHHVAANRLAVVISIAAFVVGLAVYCAGAGDVTAHCAAVCSGARASCVWTAAPGSVACMPSYATPADADAHCSAPGWGDALVQVGAVDVVVLLLWWWWW